MPKNYRHTGAACKQPSCIRLPKHCCLQGSNICCLHSELDADVGTVDRIYRFTALPLWPAVLSRARRLRRRQALAGLNVEGDVALELPCVLNIFLLVEHKQSQMPGNLQSGSRLRHCQQLCMLRTRGTGSLHDQRRCSTAGMQL